MFSVSLVLGYGGTGRSNTVPPWDRMTGSLSPTIASTLTGSVGEHLAGSFQAAPAMLTAPATCEDRSHARRCAKNPPFECPKT